ncbi:MAG: DUF3052 family protein [Actinomycetota bacterium]|nr:DUF3052 family protein [Actinomycetota bacterium]
MSDKTNAEKLQIREDNIVWVISTNDEEGALLDPLPSGAEVVDEAADSMSVAVLFVEDRDSLTAQLDEILPQLGSTPVIWISYPKGNRTDINRDSIWELVGEYGWRLVSNVSLDEVWSAVRLKQA